MTARLLAVLALSACGTQVSTAPRVDVPDDVPVERAVEDHELGPYPVSVVLVRHAQPSPMEQARLEELSAGWLSALLEHPIDWRLAVLPVATDPTVIPTGQLLPTSSGVPWIDASTVDPWAEREALLDVLPSVAGENPFLETLVQMPIQEFSFDDGVLLVAFVSETNDRSDVSAKEVGEWLQDNEASFPYREANVTVLTTLEKSTCTAEAVGSVFRNLLLHVGGYEIDICDDTTGTRVPEGYTDDITALSMQLDQPAVPESITVNFSDPSAPELSDEIGFHYDERSHTVTVDGAWVPTERVLATVRYDVAR